MADHKTEKHTQVQLKTQTQKPQTRIEVLRAVLKDLEKRITRLSEINTPTALEILSLLDRANDLIDELQARGINISSEVGQFKTLAAKFLRVKSVFIRKIGGSPKLADLRQERYPSEEHWWWYVDVKLAEENKQKTIRLLRILGITTLLLLIAVLIYNQFFAPDPAVKASYGHQQEAENAIIEGDLQIALDEIQNALGYTPEEPELYVLEGVIHEALGQVREAESSFHSAQGLSEQPEDFYNQRAIQYLMLNAPQRALDDTKTALEINPESALAYLYQGQAYEKLGKIDLAIQSYKRADEFAQKTDNVQLQAIIRINLSNIYQAITMPTFDVDETEQP